MADPVHIRPGIKRRWCPTQVDETGNYIVGLGHWAYCSDNCPDSNDITKKGTVNHDLRKVSTCSSTYYIRHRFGRPVFRFRL